MEIDKTTCHYFMVSNIPTSYRTKDLRHFFADFIAKDAFIKFHYKRRTMRSMNKIKHINYTNSSYFQSILKSTQSHSVPLCCIICLSNNVNFENFLTKYNTQLWFDADHVYLYDQNDKDNAIIADRTRTSYQCFIEPVSLDRNARLSQNTSLSYMTAQDIVKWKKYNVFNIAELNPPNYLPNGNVGTSIAKIKLNLQLNKIPNIKDFMQSLGLNSNDKTRDILIHGIEKASNLSNVSYQYPNSHTSKTNDNSKDNGSCKDREKKTKTKTATTRTKDQSQLQDVNGTSKRKRTNNSNRKKRRNLNKRNDNNSDSDLEYKYSVVEQNLSNLNNEEMEEWDRHLTVNSFENEMVNTRSYYDRMPSHYHTFEYKVDNPWNKGDASGLVYYTDDFYWDNKITDFDERLADDWNVDNASKLDHLTHYRNVFRFEKTDNSNSDNESNNNDDARRPIHQRMNRAQRRRKLKQKWQRNNNHKQNNQNSEQCCLAKKSSEKNEKNEKNENDDDNNNNNKDMGDDNTRGSLHTKRMRNVDNDSNINIDKSVESVWLPAKKRQKMLAKNLHENKKLESNDSDCFDTGFDTVAKGFAGKYLQQYGWKYGMRLGRINVNEKSNQDRVASDDNDGNNDNNVHDYNHIDSGTKNAFDNLYVRPPRVGLGHKLGLPPKQSGREEQRQESKELNQLQNQAKNNCNMNKSNDKLAKEKFIPTYRRNILSQRNNKRCKSRQLAKNEKRKNKDMQQVSHIMNKKDIICEKLWQDDGQVPFNEYGVPMIDPNKPRGRQHFITTQYDYDKRVERYQQMIKAKGTIDGSFTLQS